ncbi:hypothetical protein LCGC14_2749510 [marine sediment metagenome]|uniref:Uncharacterized protein n=1 Tax=marine sediment metagenome TaxID=412755 RepID=A0A0F8Z235_9ZZZZ
MLRARIPPIKHKSVYLFLATPLVREISFESIQTMIFLLWIDQSVRTFSHRHKSNRAKSLLTMKNFLGIVNSVQMTCSIFVIHTLEKRPFI